MFISCSFALWANDLAGRPVRDQLARFEAGLSAPAVHRVLGQQHEIAGLTGRLVDELGQRLPVLGQAGSLLTMPTDRSDPDGARVSRLAGSELDAVPLDGAPGGKAQPELDLGQRRLRRHREAPLPAQRPVRAPEVADVVVRGLPALGVRLGPHNHVQNVERDVDLAGDAKADLQLVVASACDRHLTAPVAKLVGIAGAADRQPVTLDAELRSQRVPRRDRLPALRASACPSETNSFIVLPHFDRG